jgi:hypothetical protein
VDDEMIVKKCETKKEHHPPSTKEVVEKKVHEESYQEKEGFSEVKHV